MSTGPNPFVTRAIAEHATAVTAGKVQGTKLIASIRGGNVTAEQLAAQLRRIVLSDFAQDTLIGVAAALISELREESAP